MNIALNRISITNFKGLKSFSCDFGQHTVISAANGVGKTTIYDAFLYLLFGKSSDGRKQFELRPLDDDGKAIEGIVLAVEARISFDETSVVIRKEQREKYIKNKLAGYETYCFIDEVPTSVKDYESYISSVCPEDTFRMLTDLRQFCYIMHWTKRRSVLLEMAGNISKPSGFDKLLADMKGRPIDDYRKVITEQKKKTTNERDEIGPRIDELQRGLDEYAGGDSNEKIGAARFLVLSDIEGFDRQRKTLLDSELSRHDKIKQTDQIRRDMITRECQLKTDTSGIQSLIDERNNITENIAGRDAFLVKTKSGLVSKKIEIDDAKELLKRTLAQMENVRQEYLTIKRQEDNANCPMCSQSLPADQIKTIADKKAAKLAELKENGDKINVVIEQIKKNLNRLAETYSIKESELKAIEAAYAMETAAQQKRLAEIQSAIDSREPAKPETDNQWKQLKALLDKTNTEIGEPVGDKLRQIEDARKQKQDELTVLDKALAQVDQIKQSRKRIIELEEKTRKLSQQITECDKTLEMIEQYKAAESSLIETAVNDKFKLVEFKLFSQNLNGSTDDCCEVTYKGVPYADLSTGQQIVTGIDIVNSLSRFYGVSAPVFIDHAESVTLQIECESQAIELHAKKSVKTLTVTTKE